MTELVPPRGRRLLDRLGINRAVGYSLAGTAWGAVARVVTLLLTIEFLSSDQQGYALTFASLLAVQQLFDLGFGLVVQQFVSHEAGPLGWDGDRLTGDPTAVARVAGLFRQGVAWYAGVGGALTLLLWPAGCLFFTRSAGSEAWLAGWSLTVLAAVAGTLVGPVGLTLNGLGRVAEVARLTATSQVVASVASWGLLAAGAGLSALPLGTCVGAGYLAAGYARRHGRLVLDLWRRPGGDRPIRWRVDIWPFQWRVSVSWAAGYLILHAFNPLVFYFQGPVAAGRVGLTLLVCTQVLWVAYTWLGVRMPELGRLVARNQTADLRRVFARAFWPSLALAVVGAAGVVATLAALGWAGSRYATRFLPPAAAALPAGWLVAQHVINGMVCYLRAYRQEPLMAMMVVTGVAGAGLTAALAASVPYQWVFAGQSIMTAGVGVPWAVAVFNRRRAREADAPG